MSIARLVWFPRGLSFNLGRGVALVSSRVLGSRGLGGIAWSFADKKS